MEFAGINYIAILLAGVASMAVGAAWYGALAKPWMKAVGLKEEDIVQEPKLYVIAAICQFIIAFFLAGVVGHLDIYTLVGGIVTAFFCWFGFVVPTMVVNHRFQGAVWNLTLIDAGHWLCVFLLQGAIIGWMGA